MLAPLALAPWAIGMAGPVYAVVATVLGIVFVALAVGIWFDTGERYARRTFAYSILYLFLLFAVLIGERLLGFQG